MSTLITMPSLSEFLYRYLYMFLELKCLLNFGCKEITVVLVYNKLDATLMVL